MLRKYTPSLFLISFVNLFFGRNERHKAVRRLISRIYIMNSQYGFFRIYFDGCLYCCALVRETRASSSLGLRNLTILCCDDKAFVCVYYSTCCCAPHTKHCQRPTSSDGLGFWNQGAMTWAFYVGLIVYLQGLKLSSSRVPKTKRSK